ncbi:MAG: glycosyltransferase family 2 protein [Gemmatimonadaceae bacterium]
MLLLAGALALLALGLWLPNLVDLVAIARTLFRRRRGPRLASAPVTTPRLLFLVPAHNEEELIAHCVRSLVAMDYPIDCRRIVVIADNSTDATATLARQERAECLERFDTVHRGKPRALAWALRQFDLAQFEACVIVDADTVVAPGFARGLAALAPLEHIAVQTNTGTMNEWDNWLTRLEGLLGRCRYEVSYKLREAAGLHCPLTGNGMCIGRDLLRDGWQAFSLTENWELFARYTAEGVSVRYAHDAQLFGQTVRSLSQGQTQRSRWLAGRTWALKTWWRKILSSAKTEPSDRFATLAELAALSPVLQLVAAIVVASLALVLSGPARFLIAAAALTSLASLVITTSIVLAKHPYPVATMLAFLRLPLYAVWRASVAASTLLLPNSGEWLKTERHPV